MCIMRSRDVLQSELNVARRCRRSCKEVKKQFRVIQKNQPPSMFPSLKGIEMTIQMSTSLCWSPYMPLSLVMGAMVSILARFLNEIPSSGIHRKRRVGKNENRFVLNMVWNYM